MSVHDTGRHPDVAAVFILADMRTRRRAAAK
jgi:hypothetical protein